MTAEQAEALGRRYLAAGGKWLPGMLDGYGGGRYHVGEQQANCPLLDGYDYWPISDECWPDLRDPATLGCVEAEVEERCEGVTLFRANGGWSVDAWDTYWTEGSTDSYAEALICALEAAP
jgi:hypothetical protein